MSFFDKGTHNGVQSVKGFIKKQVFRTAGKRQSGGGLPLHSFGEGADGFFGIQSESIRQFPEPFLVKPGEGRLIKLGHTGHTGAAEKVKFIRHKTDLRFDRFIFPNRLAVNQHLARIRTVHPGDEPQ